MSETLWKKIMVNVKLGKTNFPRNFSHRQDWSSQFKSAGGLSRLKTSGRLRVSDEKAEADRFHSCWENSEFFFSSRLCHWYLDMLTYIFLKLCSLLKCIWRYLNGERNCVHCRLKVPNCSTWFVPMMTSLEHCHFYWKPSQVPLQNIINTIYPSTAVVSVTHFDAWCIIPKHCTVWLAQQLFELVGHLFETGMQLLVFHK